MVESRELLTDRARKVIQLAKAEARYYKYVGTGHILLGLIMEGSGVAATVLRNLDVDLVKIRRMVKIPKSETAIENSEVAAFFDHVIVHVIEEMKKLNHHYVGTEHLLLGLLCIPESFGRPFAAQILQDLGLKRGTVREAVLNLLGCGAPVEASDESAKKPERFRPVREEVMNLFGGSEPVEESSDEIAKKPKQFRPAPPVRRIPSLRMRSGEIDDDRPLVSFLYQLLRDHRVPPGDIEKIMHDCPAHGSKVTHYTNGYLAQYAQDVADRLVGSANPAPEEEKPQQAPQTEPQCAEAALKAIAPGLRVLDLGVLQMLYAAAVQLNRNYSSMTWYHSATPCLYQGEPVIVIKKCNNWAWPVLPCSFGSGDSQFPIRKFDVLNPELLCEVVP